MISLSPNHPLTASEFVGMRLYGWMLQYRELIGETSWVTEEYLRLTEPVPVHRVKEALLWCDIAGVIQTDITEVHTNASNGLKRHKMYRAKTANEIAKF